jgi:hypothetical protein
VVRLDNSLQFSRLLGAPSRVAGAPPVRESNALYHAISLKSQGMNLNQKKFKKKLDALTVLLY